VPALIVSGLADNVGNTGSPRVRHPWTNETCEWLNRTILEEYYQVAYRTKIYETLLQLNDDFHVVIAAQRKVLENIQLSKNASRKKTNGRVPAELFLLHKKIGLIY